MTRPCAHPDAVPVTSAGEVVAALCPTCDMQLPAAWLTCRHDETIEISSLGDPPGERLCLGCNATFWESPPTIEFHTRVASVMSWTPPREGELVPDHPPIDLTPYVTDIRFEADGDG